MGQLDGTVISGVWSVCACAVEWRICPPTLPLLPTPSAFADRRAKSFSRSWSDPTPVKPDSMHDSRDSEWHALHPSRTHQQQNAAQHTEMTVFSSTTSPWRRRKDVKEKWCRVHKDSGKDNCNFRMQLYTSPVQNQQRQSLYDWCFALNVAVMSTQRIVGRHSPLLLWYRIR